MSARILNELDKGRYRTVINRGTGLVRNLSAVCDHGCFSLRVG
jgi:hypothetical protein